MVRFTAGAVVVAGLTCLATTAQADTITLDQALRRAEQRPSAIMAQADVDAARSEANGARLPLYNPELELSAGALFASGSRQPAAQVGLSQTIELGGKRDARTAAADARVAAAGADATAARLVARIEAWRAFELAVVARARLEAAKDAEQLAADIVAATQQSQAAGANTQLRVNLAGADLGRARHDRLDAETAYAQAIADLATAIGAGPGERPEPDATMPALAEPATSLDAAVARAVGSHPELAAARAELAAARADVRSADAAAVPDVTVSLAYGYQPEPDLRIQTVVVGLSVPLPLRNRNQGPRGAARALERRATIEADRLRAEIERQVRTAYDRDRRARDAVQAFDREVTERSNENLKLAQDSFLAGKIDFFEFTLVRRELFASRIDYLAAVAEAIEARAELARAAGMEVQP